MKKRLSELLRKETIKFILDAPLFSESSEFFMREMKYMLKTKRNSQKTLCYESLDSELEKQIILVKDFFLFNTLMSDLYKKDPKYHAHLLRELNINKKNALVDIDYLEKIIPSMSEINAKFKVYGEERCSKDVAWLGIL